MDTKLTHFMKKVATMLKLQNEVYVHGIRNSKPAMLKLEHEVKEMIAAELKQIETKQINIPL
jgi:hypothetical protein